MKTFLNLSHLDKEMIYEPLWPKDRCVFINMLHSSKLTEQELLDLARLYIRYQHISHRYETRKIFKVLLKKSSYSSFHELNLKTKKIHMRCK